MQFYDNTEKMTKSVARISSQRLKSIDFLRGSAAIAVVIFHAVTNTSNSPTTDTLWFRIIYDIVGYGQLGVPLFFVISGFCIHLRWAKRYAETGEAKLDFLNFWKRRIHRLYPPYLVMLCITMSLAVVVYVLHFVCLRHIYVPFLADYPQPRPLWLGMDFIAHLFMLHGLHPVFYQAGGNPVYWTLALEEYFYILYFGLIVWRQRFGLRVSTAAVLFLGVIFPPIAGFCFSPDSEWWRLINSSAAVLWIQWCLGMVAVEAYCGLIKLPRFCRLLWMVPLWGVAAQFSSDYLPLLTPFLWGMVFFTLVNYCVSAEIEEHWPQHWLVKWLASVGLFSYSLYLIHTPVRFVLGQFMAPLNPTKNPFLYLVSALIITIAGYYAGKIFYVLVERHFLNFKARNSSTQLLQEAGTE